jgi:hypothetical protein
MVEGDDHHEVLSSYPWAFKGRDLLVLAIQTLITALAAA